MFTTRAAILILAYYQWTIGWVESQDPFNISCGLYTVEDYHEHARKTLATKAMRYIDLVAGSGDTYRWNEEAFMRIRFRNKVMVDISHRKLNTTLLGSKVSLPVAISPSAAHQNAHPDGENATARASASRGVLMALGLFSTISLEQVSVAGGPDLLRWMAVELFSNISVTLDLIRRAEKVGAKAIIVTADIPTDGYRPVEYEDDYWYPNGSKFANFDKYKGLNFEKDPANTWIKISWLREQTNLPIVIKGILTAEDAKLAVRNGAKGIIVSNHGGRQLDGDPATIEVLPEIVAAVKGLAEVYLDSGVRSGNDVLRALALGARAVFIGRPLLWGLSFQGEVGAKCVLDILKYQLDIAMALTGQTDVTRINHSVVRSPTTFDVL